MLIDIHNLTITFPSAGVERFKAVDGVSFSVPAGKTVALVGESGSGKTQTALAVLGLNPPTATIDAASQISFEGTSLVYPPASTWRSIRGKEIAMIFQDPHSALDPLCRVRDQLVEAMGEELLSAVGITDPKSCLHLYPHQLSGGMAQRVMIALALACRPKLLIADEPTTALDVTIQAQILAVLKQLQKETGMAMLFIGHDLAVVNQIADEMIVMKNGRIVEKGSTAEILQAPKEAYTKELLVAAKGRMRNDEPSMPSPSALRPSPSPSRAREPHLKQNIPLPNGRGTEGEGMVQPTSLLSVAHLHTHFPIKRGIFLKTVGQVKAVDDVSFELRRGETLAIVGESGSGKTTTGLSVLRLLTEAKGQVAFNGKDIFSLKKHEMRALRRQCQIVFQNPYSSLSPRMKAGAILEEGLCVHEPQLSAQERRDRVMAVFAEVQLSPESADKYPHQFSGGQRQRIAIARALILKPLLMVLDEPTSALDVSVQAQILDLLTDLQREHQLAYLLITHNMSVVSAMADTVAVMKEGRFVEIGPTAQVLGAPQDAYTRTLLASVQKIN